MRGAVETERGRMIRKTTAPIALALALAALGATLLTGSTSAAHRRYTIVSVAYFPSTGIGGRAAAKRLGAKNTYADFRAMLEKEKPQIVSVADWFEGKKPRLPPVEQIHSGLFETTSKVA